VKRVIIYEGPFIAQDFWLLRLSANSLDELAVKLGCWFSHVRILVRDSGGLSMSHIVTIQTQLRDPVAIVAACRRLNWTDPVQGTATLFSGEATGVLVRLPGWKYPAVVDTATGAVRYDNYEGLWGDREHLDRFVQAHAVEMVKLEARRKGYDVTEQAQADGGIRLQVVEAR
jgi:hypothetical protein